MKNRFENALEQTLADRMSASQKFSLFVENLSNIQGVLKTGEYESSGNSGEIKVDTDPGRKELMLVKTDTGALVSADRELATERLSACVALFIRGPGIKYLVHLTPSTNLGYYYYRYSNPDELVKWSVKRIIEPLTQVVDPHACHGLIVPNEGNSNDGPYGKSNVSQAWSRLKDRLLEAGLGDVVMGEPLPLDEATLYWSPQEPDLIFAGGLAVNAENTGLAETRKKQMHIAIESGKLVS